MGPYFDTSEGTLTAPTVGYVQFDSRCPTLSTRRQIEIC